jgi:hypothetical protein
MFFPLPCNNVMLIMAITNLSHVREGRVKVENGQGGKVGSNPYLASNFPPPVDIDPTTMFYDIVWLLDYWRRIRK